MRNSEENFIFNSEPINWPKKNIQLLFGDINFEIKKDKSYKDKISYAVSLVIYSKKYANFLDKATNIKNKIPACPRIRRVAKTSDVETFGQVWWMILKPDWTGPIIGPSKVDSHLYKSGSKLLDIGFNIVLEKNLLRFIRECIDTLETRNGVLKAHMQDGFINLNMGSFDFFYGFVYACHLAGNTERDCLDLLPVSGVREQYPEHFDLSKISLTDIQTLYTLFDEEHE